uniref:GG22980 n=1 Tax=Drosophila erecta TaxID=7220 RepID=B3NZ41_DROER
MAIFIQLTTDIFRHFLHSQVVRAAKQKLSDYAAETLASISKRFSHLHGLLQVAELQVIEKLRESSWPPQMKLNEAMGQLDGYEAVIKRLKRNLESGADNNLGVPSDVSLNWLLKLICEHIEKMPTTVRVSKIEENPYRVTCSRFLDMSNIFKCEFVDPNIQVCFKTDFESSRRLSSSPKSSSGGRENFRPLSANRISTQKSKLNPNQMSQNQNVASLNSSAAIVDDFPDILHNFSALVFIKPNKTAEDSSDWFKTDALVRVRSVHSPEDFYVQSIHAAQRLQEEMDTFTQPLSGSCSVPPAIVVGQHYIVHRKDQDRFYRAMVSQKLTTRGVYKVFLPDMGLYLNVHSGDFRVVPERLSHLPYSVLHCSLRELMPGHGGSEWGTKASGFLKQIVQNNPVHLIVNKALTHELHEVDLITSNYNTSISVRDSFLYSGLARSRCDRESAMSPQWLQPAPTALRLPRMSFQFGDVHMIQMLHVEDPQEFYVMRHENEEKRSLLQASLQAAMERISISQLQNIFLGRLRLGCVLQSDGQWKRASIEQILADGYVLVRLVDEGPSQKVFWNQLFVLPPNFWDTGLAIKCCLADVETCAEHSYMWTPEATTCFKQLTSNPKLYMEVIRATTDVVYVALNFVRSNSETTSVGVQLVAQGYCTSSGESSRTINPPESTRSVRLDVETQKFLAQQRDRPVVEVSPYQKHDNTERNKRTTVRVLHVRKPDEFYVTLPHFEPAILTLQKSVQKAAAAMYQNMVPRSNWQVGDMCYARVQAKCDSLVLWHRGIVRKVIQPGITSQMVRCHVQLRDLGELVEDVPSSSLANIDEANMRISSSAKRCHLHGIRATGDEWSKDAIEFFMDQLQAYDDIHVTGFGHAENSLSVVLWGSLSIVSGAFSPARIKYVNINKVLLMAGMAQKDLNLNFDNEDQQSMPENVSVSFAETAKSIDFEIYRDQSDRITKTKSLSPIDSPGLKAGFEHNEDMPPLELLEDLGKTRTTTGEETPPAAWITRRKCDKAIFTAIATNVTYECCIYLTLASDKPFIEHMRNLLVREYKPLMEKQQRSTCHAYKVGQAVVVTYHMDNLIYRGIVQRLENNHDEYTVYYVDYGNMELVKADELLPYAPFPDLNAMCFLVEIHGVRSKRGKYSVQEMDTVHRTLVMKLSSVRIVDAETVGVNKLPTCQIKVGNVDIGTMMIDCNMSVPIEKQPIKKKTLYLPLQKALEEFKVFDELDNLASGEGELSEEEAPRTQRKQGSISSVQQPPIKKKFLVDQKEVEAFNCDQDFDCQQAAQKMSLNNSFYFSDFGKYAGETAADGSDDKLYSNSSENMEMEVFANNDGSQLEPLNSLAADQLRRRIALRQKEMKANISFSPMDSSSVRSFYDGSGSFKTLNLPNGVKQFQCTVDNVLSPTELQIAPCLSEFTKYEIGLIQETSTLIKDTEPLKKPRIGDLCLARYSRDKQWYRAIIKEIPPIVSPTSEQATVFYIDFHDTESVSFNHLKVMPSRLFMFPLRSFRVKLHGVKKNKNFEDKSVRQALQACLCRHPLLFARVHYPLNYHANNVDRSNGESDLIEVELFENRHSKKLVYQSLCENWMFLTRT